MDKTIHETSYIGQRIKSVKKGEKFYLTVKGKKVPLIKKITIGRDKANDISLDDALVSRFHAVIQKMKNDYYIQDRGSTNGTYVNNKRIPADLYIKLTKKDRIKIGKNEICLLDNLV